MQGSEQTVLSADATPAPSLAISENPIILTEFGEPPPNDIGVKLSQPPPTAMPR